MKLNITYLLLLLVISPNLYGAEVALPPEHTQVESSELAFTGQAIKGLSEIIETWEQKTIPSKWVKKGNSWEEQTALRNRKLATFVILGSNPKNPHDTNIAAYHRPLHAYHFIESQLYGKELLCVPLKDDAEKISLTTRSEKIKQFEKTIRASSIGSHLTFAPQQSADDIKSGYRSQLLESLIATENDYNQTKDSGAFRRYLVVRAALAHELEKSTKALAIREKQMIEKKHEAEALKAAISTFNAPMSNEFVFYMNALIDVHQSENRFLQAENTDSDEQTIDCIFNAADAEFILNRSELVTKKQDGSEHIVHFGPFMKKDGRLPVEECAAQARKIYKTWYSSIGEPADATALRTMHDELLAKRKELEKEQSADRQLFITKQIEILQESRDDAFKNLRSRVFEAAKVLTSKDLAAYCSIAQNRTRLSFKENYLLEEQSDIALEKEKINEIDKMCAKQLANDNGKQEA